MSLPKIEVKKILYATDLSENARPALAYAIHLANHHKAGLTILHVITEDLDLETRIAGYITEERWQEIRSRHFQEARQALIGKQRDSAVIRDVLGTFSRDLSGTAAQFQTDEVLVEKGDPAAQILRICEEKQIDLIVMGSHGYSAFKDVVMGGTARKVLRRTRVPVLLVPVPE